MACTAPNLELLLNLATDLADQTNKKMRTDSLSVISIRISHLSVTANDIHSPTVLKHCSRLRNKQPVISTSHFVICLQRSTLKRLFQVVQIARRYIYRKRWILVRAVLAPFVRQSRAPPLNLNPPAPIVK